VFEEEEDPSNKSFFSEIISSVSDVKFSRDGRYILSRDYLSLRIWDVNMEVRGPAGSHLAQALTPHSLNRSRRSPFTTTSDPSSAISTRTTASSTSSSARSRATESACQRRLDWCDHG
jgi:hypothetical protein